MKSAVTSAIVISLAASGVAAVAAAHNKKRQLRGGNPNQQHRSLEGECVGVPNGQWRPTPGCHGAALCMNDEEFFLYPCNEEEGFLYDEARGGCAPKAEVVCKVGWESIGVEGDSAGDGETGDGEGVSDANANADTDADAEAEDETELDAETDVDAETDADADAETVDTIDAEEDTSDGTEEAAGVEETGNEKEKRMCNTMEERAYFKACKKFHCVGLTEEDLEDCKEMCRLQECTYEDEDEEEDEEGN